jgi:methionine synthase II (cobalamin-independent)
MTGVDPADTSSGDTASGDTASRDAASRGAQSGDTASRDVPPGRFPWAPGSATGVGSLPGTDIVEAVRTILGELPDLPYLPELPSRGPGADMIGRAAGLLVDMPVELYAGRWRIAGRPGIDLRRTHDLWARDLDALTDQASEYAGPIKLAVAGPWTLAASVDLPIGGRLLRDPGAVRDLVASLAEAVATLVRDVSARLPSARVLVQLDEPSLPLALAGRVATESGLGMLRVVEESTARDALTAVIAAAGVPVVVHCCAADVPIGLFRDAGAVAVGLDLDQIDIREPAQVDPLAEALDAGLGLFAGAIPATVRAPDAGSSGARVSGGGSSRAESSRAAWSRAGSSRAGSSDAASSRARSSGDRSSGPPPAGAAAERRIRELWRTIGFSANDLAAQVVVTPSCGLAGATEARARAVTAACREAAKRLALPPDAISSGLRSATTLWAA